jgi:anti-sigma-K factor RskA
MTRPHDPRASELLADRALHGVDEAEARELQAMNADADDSFDLAAAAIDLATVPVEPMPAGVADRILATHQRAITGWAVTTGKPVAAPIKRRQPAVTWFATAGSILLVAGVSWWLFRGKPPITVAAARAQLLAGTPDAATLAWKPSPEAPGASGDIVWSPTAQRGYMRFVDLPRNDPTTTQYQLWIFDRERDQAYPVDGGVFDVAATGEVIVPITAKLHVGDATLFAVTIEPPGGVVVSRREHIAVIAAGS